MSVLLSPVGNGQQFFDDNGIPLAGGYIYTYQAGSSTPLATYTDVNGNIANSNPIVLNTAGRLPSELWLTTGFSYKFIIKTAADVLIDTLDNLYPILQTSTAVGDFIPPGLIAIWSGSTGSIPSGWYLCDGSNGTPNLRDSFIIGAGNNYAVGATGGSLSSIPTGSVTSALGGTAITEAQMPKHFHRTWGPPPVYTGGTVPGVDSPGTSYPGRGVFNGGTPDDGATDYGTWSVGGGAASGGTDTGTGAASEHTHSISVSLSGVSVTTLPPYYALAFIMKA